MTGLVRVVRLRARRGGAALACHRPSQQVDDLPAHRALLAVGQRANFRQQVLRDAQHEADDLCHGQSIQRVLSLLPV